MASHDTYLIPYLLSALDVVVSLLASGHVILSKRDTRAAIGWIGLIWLSPLVGTVLYWLLGINRISRKARSMRRDHASHRPEDLRHRAARDASPAAA